MTLEQARELIPTAVRRMDQPTHDGVNTFLVCRAIREAGLKVAISGQGADELFLGYAQRRRFPLTAHAARAVPSRLRPALAAVARALDGRPRAAKGVWSVAAEDPIAGAYLAHHAIFSQTEIETLRGVRRPPMTRFIEDVGGRDMLDRLSRLQIRHYLKNTLLRDGDQMSMATSVELRAPFVDADLLEHVVSLPSQLKVSRDRNKPLLLDAVGPALPREVWDRPKRGFGLPYGRWLREGLDQLFAGSEHSPLRRDRVEAIRHAFLGGQHWTRYWTLIVLQDWIARERLGTQFL
jgi:asparagine synthase (glutamine-hydrolysing)